MRTSSSEASSDAKVRIEHGDFVLHVRQDCWPAQVDLHYRWGVAAVQKRVLCGVAGLKLQPSFVLAAAEERIGMQLLSRRLSPNDRDVCLRRRSDDY